MLAFHWFRQTIVLTWVNVVFFLVNGLINYMVCTIILK